MPPGPIQNHLLFQEDRTARVFQKNELPKMKDGLVSEKDYKTVCKEVWEKFTMIYGGGPAIIRCS
jgi:hypothetical protein